MRGISIDAQNRSQCGTSEGTCTWRQKNHFPWCCQHMNFIWVSWAYFGKLTVWKCSSPPYLFLPYFVLISGEKRERERGEIVIPFPLYLPCLVPCDFYFPRTQDFINGEEILWYYHDLRNITGCICFVSNNVLHKMLQVMTVAGFTV